MVPGSAVKPTASQPSPHNEATVRVQMESSIREIKISLVHNITIIGELCRPFVNCLLIFILEISFGGTVHKSC